MLIPLKESIEINWKFILRIIRVILLFLLISACFINVSSQYRLDSWTTDNGLPQNSVQDILQSQDGYLWLTTNGGIVRFDGMRFKVFNKSNTEGLIESRYTMTLEDSSGRLWFLTEDNTIVKYENGNFTTLTLQNGGMPGKLINRFYKDHNGILTFTTEEGHFRYQDGMFKKFEIPTSRQKTYICFIDNEGGIWLTESLSSKTDKHNLRRILGDQVTYFDFETKGDPIPPFIYEDRFKNYWVSISAGSLNRIYNGKTQFIPIDVGFYTDFLEDADGNLWLGTYDTGLIRYKDGKFTRITEKDGMFNGNVFCTLEDDNGWFWINSNQGIYRVKKEQLNDFADGKIKKVDSLAYNKNDGLLNTEGNGGFQPAGVRRRNGELWFPTQQGVAVIEPNKISINPLVPPVYLEEVSIDNQDIGNYGNEIKIQPGQNNLEIHYTGLSFVNSPMVKFRYRLEGLEEDWNEIGTRRFALYNNLPPGEYTFQVLAANRDAVWNMEGASIKIVKLPFFYQTWWFIALLVLISAAIISLIFYNRFSHLKNIAETKQKFLERLIESQEAERKRIAVELHDGVGQSLAIISNRAAMGKKKKDDPHYVFKEFEEISLNALGALDEVHEITSNLHPHYLERLGLTKALKSMFTNISGVMKLDCEIDTIDDIFPKNSEINVYRIVQESLNNVIKHSEASEAAISIKRTEKEVEITITDNGKGFDSNKSKESGLGLVGLNERTKFIGGKLIIKSAIGTGTEIKINLPIVKLN